MQGCRFRQRYCRPAKNALHYAPRFVAVDTLEMCSLLESASSLPEDSVISLVVRAGTAQIVPETALSSFPRPLLLWGADGSTGSVDSAMNLVLQGRSNPNVRIAGSRAGLEGPPRHIVCGLESPLGWEFELLGQSLESGLIADDLVGGENEERAQEGIAFGKRNVEPFEGR